MFNNLCVGFSIPYLFSSGDSTSIRRRSRGRCGLGIPRSCRGRHGRTTSPLSCWRWGLWMHFPVGHSRCSWISCWGGLHSVSPIHATVHDRRHFAYLKMRFALINLVYKIQNFESCVHEFSKLCRCRSILHDFTTHTE